MVSAIAWTDGPPPAIRLLDQTRLPHEVTYRDVTRLDELRTAIAELAVRGAPALGGAGALGVALAMAQADREGWDQTRLDTELELLRSTRPTAVNLAWAVDRIRPLIPDGRDAVLAAALALVAEDGAANRELSRLGADWIEDLVCRHRGRRVVRVATHCNTGALATTAWGTAYGIIHTLHERARLGLVYVDETRPLLQGTRLTSWELHQDGIDHVVQADGAAAGTILRGLVDVVIFGADRITANGDVANKVGSVALALAAVRAGIPCVVAAPSSTVDLATATGADIEIEERAEDEVLTLAGKPLSAPGTRAWNPAFDVTPHDLVSAIVTERGIVEPDTAGPGALAALLS